MAHVKNNKEATGEGANGSVVGVKDGEVDGSKVYVLHGSGFWFRIQVLEKAPHK